MATSRRSLLKNSAATAATLSLGGRLARAETEEVRIGVIYDLSGPFAAGGSVACSIGCQIAIDLVNERGGIAGKTAWNDGTSALIRSNVPLPKPPCYNFPS